MPNWNNLKSVIAYAKTMGKGMTVFKHPDRDNYNITHTSRTDRYDGCVVCHQT